MRILRNNPILSAALGIACSASALTAQITAEVRSVTGVSVFLDDGTTHHADTLPSGTLIAGQELRATAADGSWMRARLSRIGASGVYGAHVYLQANPLSPRWNIGTGISSAGGRAPFRIALRVTGPAGQFGLLRCSANGTRPAAVVPEGRFLVSALGHRFTTPLVPPLVPNGTSSVVDSASWLVQIPSSGMLEAEIEAEAFLASGIGAGFSAACGVEFEPGPGCAQGYFGYEYAYSPSRPVIGQLDGAATIVGGQLRVQIFHWWIPNTPGALVLGIQSTSVPLFGTWNPLLVAPIVVIPFDSGSTGQTMWSFSTPDPGLLDVRAQVLSSGSTFDLSNGLHVVCIP
jgi:hypothetical protein